MSWPTLSDGIRNSVSIKVERLRNGISLSYYKIRGFLARQKFHEPGYAYVQMTEFILNLLLKMSNVSMNRFLKSDNYKD